MLSWGWSELTATNAPVEDEPVEPVLRMNISLPACVFFFPDPPCPKILYQKNSLPPPSYLPSTSPLLPTTYLQPPTYRLPTPPPLTPETSSSCGAGAMVVERELELWLWSGSWSCGCGAGAGAARAGARPTRPLGLHFFFCFFCLFCLKKA